MTKKDKIKWLAQLASSIAILAFLICSFDFRKVVEQIADLSANLLLAAFVFNTIGGLIVTGYQYYHTLIDHSTHRAWSFVKINFILRFYSLVMPGVVATGIRWGFFRRLGINNSQTMHLMMMNKLVQVLVLSTVFIGMVLSSDTFQAKVDDFYGLILLLSLSCAAGVIFLFFFMFSGFGRHFVHRRWGWEGNWLLKKVVGKLRTFLTATSTFTKRKLATVLALGVLSHLLIIVSQYLVCLGLNVGLDIFEIAFVRSFVVLLMIIPISVGGLGVREAGFVGGLALFGVAGDVGLALALVLLFFQVINGIVGFLFSVLTISNAGSVKEP